MNTPTKSSKKLKLKNAIDFESLSLSGLKKYRRQYHIRVKPTAPKAELAAAIAEHFSSIPGPVEDDAISGFLEAVQRNRSKREVEEDSTEQLSTSSPIKSKKKQATHMEKTNTNASVIKNTSQSNNPAKKKRLAERARS